MSISYRNSAVPATILRREHDRSPVALPAIVTLGGNEYSARILNLAPGGALIECAASFPPAATFLVRCGSIAADSVVVWQQNGRYGVNFRLPLSEEQVKEQLSRNSAISDRKLPKGEANSPTDKRPATMSARQMLDTAGSSALAAHLSAIEACHHLVESCACNLETILASELSDIGQFSTARLRLRQANVARTQVVLDTCRHLMAIYPAQHSLRQLQQRELDVSHTISAHVQSWTVPALLGDWDGYCLATKKVLADVRELIAAEKKMLCPVLRGGRVREYPPISATGSRTLSSPHR